LAAHPDLRHHRRVLRIAALVVLAAAPLACVQADLEGHACPCIDGYVCQDDVCVKDTGGPPPEDRVCPEQFAPSDACSTAPPARATLVAACDDGDSYPDAIREELGAGGGTCVNGPSVSLTGDTLTGSFTYANDRITLTLSGHTTWQYDIPSNCAQAGCLASEGSGTCVNAAGGGCRCTDVELVARSDNLDAFNGNYVGTDAYFGCYVGDRFALRETGGLGLGAILVFEADE
jgi:hypothetical protein